MFGSVYLFLHMQTDN